ncbi:ribonuclease P protein subunit p21 [Anabrus simplex]|uniref:ribonuclease P protein subunit p21 n=1 Tax=Anabrus simplex TaxID=316456 RepID=UPI0034DD4DE3
MSESTKVPVSTSTVEENCAARKWGELNVTASASNESPYSSNFSENTTSISSELQSNKISDDNKRNLVNKNLPKGSNVPCKKNKKKAKEDEAFQRLNFLYQAQHVVMAACPNYPDIAAYYGYNLFSIAKKNLVKLQPSLKRTICKGCQSLLIPGVSARVRVRKQPSRCVLWTCIRCQTQRRFLTRRDYNLWSERPEAYVS